jgi:hypothetical protein
MRRHLTRIALLATLCAAMIGCQKTIYEARMPLGEPLVAHR